MKYYSKKLQPDYQKVLNGVNFAKSLMSLIDKRGEDHSEDLEQYVFVAYAQAKKRGKEIEPDYPGGPRAFTAKNEAIRNLRYWAAKTALNWYEAFKKNQGEYEVKPINFSLLGEYKKDSADIEYKEKDEDELIAKIKIPSPEEDAIREDEELESKVREVNMTFDSFSDALGIFEAQEFKLNEQEKNNIQCWEWMRRRKFVKERDGKYYLKANDLLLRALWYMVKDDDTFRFIMSILAGHNIKFPTLKEQFSASVKNRVYEIKRNHEELKDEYRKRNERLKYPEKEFILAGLIQLNKDIANRSELKLSSGLAEFKSPDDETLLSDSRLSQIYAEEKDFREKRRKWKEDPLSQVDLEIARTRLARLLWLVIQEEKKVGRYKTNVPIFIPKQDKSKT